MMQNNPKTHWLIDAALFGGFLVALWLDRTGLAVHQLLGLGVGLLACYHLASHGRWVVAVTRRFLGRTSRQARTWYAVDLALAVGFAAILVTGVAMSTWLGLPLVSYASWRSVHVLTSVLALALVVVKIGLHWRWIANVARRSIFAGAAAPARSGSAAPVPAAGTAGRRDFLKLMGGAVAVSLLAGVQVLSGNDHGETQTSSAAQTSGGAGTLVRSTAGDATSSCIVQCQRQCSYPGHCRRYTDSNGNRRCDYGECLS